MSPAPFVDVSIVDAPPPPAPQNDTGTFFVVGFSDRGATTGQVIPADIVTSLGDFVARYGARQSYNGPEYDAVEGFFDEGGSRLFFSRKVGPAAVAASAGVPAATPKFTATARGPGASYNGPTGLSVGVASGVITVYDNGVPVEVSPPQPDVVAAQTWAASISRLITITPVGTGALTDSTPVNLAGGTDDRTATTDAQIQAALDRLPRNLGPGDVALPGDVRLAAYTMAATHARDNNRFAYGDAPDTNTVATISGLGTSMRALGREIARHIQILEPWLTKAGTGGTIKTVPPSGLQAGMAARVDGTAGGGPHVAVAGPRASMRSVIAPKYSRTRAERDTLADAGVTSIVAIDNAVQTYDDITPVDQLLEPEWTGAAVNRLLMAIVADARAVGRAHLFSGTDAVDLVAFNGDLRSMLLSWFQRRALYRSAVDAPADNSYRVETGPTVNTTATIQARQLKAAISLKPIGTARFVTITVTNQGPAEVL